MLSLIGIPRFPAFMGKLYVFGCVTDKGLYWFAAIGALNAAVAGFYYMRVLKAMLIGDGSGTTAPLQVPFLNQASVVALLLSNVLLIVFWNPTRFLHCCLRSTFRRSVSLIRSISSYISP